MRDVNNIELKNGDIIHIHQTVNGENLFIIFDVDFVNLSVRYARDLTLEYEYDKYDLIAPSFLTNEVEFEIIGNIYNYLNTLR